MPQLFDMVEITVKVLNTLNHSILPLGKEFNFYMYRTGEMKGLSDMFRDNINIIIKESMATEKCWEYDLYTKDKQKIELERSLETYFTDKGASLLDLMDRNETIFYAILTHPEEATV